MEDRNRFILICLLLTTVMLVLSGCDGDNYKAETKCGKWVAPKGGDDCWRCHTPDTENRDGKKCSWSDGFPGDDCGLIPLKFFGRGYECTEAMCTSLGISCKFMDSKDKGGQCISQPTPLIDIRITDAVASYSCDKASSCSLEESSNGIKVNGLLEPFTTVNLTFTTRDAINKNLYATKCYYTTDPNLDAKEAVSTQYFQGDSFTIGHTFSVVAPSGQVNNATKYSYYITCEDQYSDERSTPFFAFEFSVAPLPDVYYPIIEAIKPENGLFKHNLTSPLVDIIVNDDSGIYNCRWNDIDSSILYNSSNDLLEFSCSAVQTNSMKYDCSGRISNVSAIEKNYYFRCMDKKKNVDDIINAKGYSAKYTDMLNITSVLCPHYEVTECKGNVYSEVINLSVYSTGGVDSGRASCSFSINGSPWVEFLETNQSGGLSYQPNLHLASGTNNIKIKCKDDVDNEAKIENKVVFEKDVIAPKIAKLYADSTFVYIITNEKATCRYSNSLPFSYENATEVSSADGLTHMISYLDQSYFVVECKDIFSNSAGAIYISVVKK